MTKESSVETFLDELASSKATPGGGSAAAVMGAMGAALVSMVCNRTIGGTIIPYSLSFAIIAIPDSFMFF